MKRNYIVKLLLLFISASLLTACGGAKKETSHITHEGKDTTLNYLLQPVNEQVVAVMPVVQAVKESAIYNREINGRINYDTRNQVNLSSRISGRIEKLYIKYNYQPVKKGQLVLEIYSPDLAAAQRELLLINDGGNEEGMLAPAIQRLLLLGMSRADIDKVLRTKKISYKVPVYSPANGYIVEKTRSAISAPAQAPVASAASGAGMAEMGGVEQPAAPILLREGQYLNAGQSIFTVYEASSLVAEFSLSPQDVAQLQRKEKVIIARTAQPDETIKGEIGMLLPVMNAGENFVVARIYLASKGLQVGELVTGYLPFMTKKTYWVPQEAVLSLGNSSLVFKREGKVFVPKAVKTGIKQHQKIEVLDEISGWDIAKNAYYLVDSESFIKTENKGN